jgi:hypothetical protein
VLKLAASYVTKKKTGEGKKKNSPISACWMICLFALVLFRVFFFTRQRLTLV